LREIPARQNSDQVSDAVVRGKHIWDRENCMGCHTILGEGAYYAPELTRVVDRRSPEWIAFLDWVGQIDTNGFPPAPSSFNDSRA
jgi:nitric oxide reductase subunit C